MYRRPNSSKRIFKMRNILQSNPGLTDAFRVARKHYIVRNIRENFIFWGSLTDKQIALVFKIADQVQSDQKNWVPAPKLSGRVEVVAEILSVKEKTFYVNSWTSTFIYKAMMSVQLAPGRNYKTWGTIPESVIGSDNLEELKGRKVKFQARFTVADNDPTMTFYSRPSKFTVLS